MEIIEIDSVQPHPANARAGNVDLIATSLEAHGQQKPIVVQRSSRYIIAGNHVWQAAKKLSWTKIGAEFTDLDDDAAARYMLIDNKTTDVSQYRDEDLLTLLQTVNAFEGTGFEFDDMEDLEDKLGGNTIEAIPETIDKIRSDQVNSKPQDPEAFAKKEAMRDVLLMMPVSAAQQFGSQVVKLQKSYGTSTVVDTVRRAIQEAVDRLPTEEED